MGAPMVRALLAGTKTQTRRIVKMHRRDHTFVLEELPGGAWWPFRSDDGESSTLSDGNEYPYACPYGVPGDTLWVRETWNVPPGSEAPGDVVYRADLTDEQEREARAADRLMRIEGGRWRSSIHMPRWASRLTLTLTDVRVERLQEISENDAKAEGVAFFHVTPGSDPNGWYPEGYRTNYQATWESINGPGSWDANPWVWVLCFTPAPNT